MKDLIRNRKIAAIEGAQEASRSTQENWTVFVDLTVYYPQLASDDDHNSDDYFCTITPNDVDTDPFEILNNLSKYRIY
jgi:hypothetical protein